jgi:hypothetical protein
MMNPEMIKALTPMVLAVLGGMIAIASLFSPNADKGLAAATAFGFGAAGAYQNRSSGS